jgi:hypothetical protein
MTRTVIGIRGGLLTLVLVGAIQAFGQTPAPWLHVRVEEPRRQSRVAVNLPLSVVEVALRSAPDKTVPLGHFNLDHHRHDLKVADLRRMWAELKTAGDAELVSVEDGDEHVRIARDGGLVVIRVEKPAGSDAVRIDVPTQVVDALLSGDGDELNVKAALAELQKRRGDIVRVNDKGQSVRIWIDEQGK